MARRNLFQAAGTVLVALVLAVTAALVTAGAAQAHATLLHTDPPDGAVVPDSPAVLSLTFDQNVVPPPGAVRVFDATGTSITTTFEGHGAVQSASVPPHLPRGSYVVVWRVISADSHLVGGSFTFSVGAPSLTVAAPKVSLGPNHTLLRAMGIAAGLDYVGLLLAGGLALFEGWVVGATELEDRARRRVRRTRWVAVGLAAVASLALVPLNGANDLGLGVHRVVSRKAFDLTFVGEDLLVFVLQLAGLVLAAILATRTRTASPTRARLLRAGLVVAAAVAVCSPALVGHSRATSPTALVLAADVAHLAAGAVWFGGLVGLVLCLRRLHPGAASVVLVRFSTVAAATLGVVTLTGTFAAWRILDSWSAFVTTGYGRLLLVKIGVVATIALVAAGNRWLLVPRARDVEVEGGADGATPRGLRALARVQTTVRAEAGLLVVVLGLTGFLVGLSPHPAPTQRPVDASRVAVIAVGHDRVLAILSPGRVGPNTLTVQVQDQTGEPLEVYSPPTAGLSLDGLDLGDQPLEPVAAGTYAANVVLPRAGAWTLAVGLRLSEFVNPVRSLTLTVSP